MDGRSKYFRIVNGTSGMKKILLFCNVYVIEDLKKVEDKRKERKAFIVEKTSYINSQSREK